MSSRDEATAVATEGLGRRIRQARVTKGWTQGELAGTDFSVGYISRIESGERTPSGSTLNTLATRLDVSVEYLTTGVDQDERLARHSDVDQTELMLAGGDVSAALSMAAALIDSKALKPFPDLERRARVVHALCSEAKGDIHAAIMELEDLDKAQAEWEPDAEIGIALTRCYREVDEYAKAIRAGKKVMAALRGRGLSGTAEYIRLAVTVSGAHFEAGEIGEAMRMVRRAIGEAEAVDSPQALASAYWNASVYESSAGNLDRAVRLSTKALAVLESGESNRNVARLRKQLAVFLILDPTSDIAEARGQLELATRELGWSSANPVELGRNKLAWARLHLREGAPDLAVEAARSVPSDARAIDPSLATEARVLEVLGLVSSGQPYEAAYQDATALLTVLGCDRGTAQFWFELGEAMTTAGETAESALAYRQSSRALGASRVVMPVHSRTAFSLAVG